MASIATFLNQHSTSTKIIIKIIYFVRGFHDTQTGVPFGIPKGARCVQRFDDSLNSAIHITYHISLCGCLHSFKLVCMCKKKKFWKNKRGWSLKVWGEFKRGRATIKCTLNFEPVRCCCQLLIGSPNASKSLPFFFLYGLYQQGHFQKWIAEKEEVSQNCTDFRPLRLKSHPPHRILTQ
ncbi:hypothetical protein VP01_18g2 [Puccinia sorghi]|uniref:Uncharacterized protein n=1 Tax=Puccinia sorghi TaxID=27349 RepID=A0A0L6VCS2_9BASI|nr:hypothetical protein VP01_18g2 [Puccinia sorghi]